MTPEQLFEKWMPLAMSIARRYRAGWSVRPEELENAALVGLWRAARDYNPNLAGFGTIVGPRILWSIRDYLREVCGLRNKFKRVRAATGFGEDFDRHDPVAERPWQRLQNDDLVKVVLGAVKEAEAEAVRLVYLEGLPNREAASKLGLTRSGLQTRLRRAFASMAGRLRGREDELP